MLYVLFSLSNISLTSANSAAAHRHFSNTSLEIPGTQISGNCSWIPKVRREKRRCNCVESVESTLKFCDMC